MFKDSSKFIGRRRAATDQESQLEPAAPKPFARSGSVPYGPFAAVVYSSVVYFAAGYILAPFALIAVLRAIGWNQSRVQSWFDGSVYGQFWYVLLAEALTFAAIWWFLRLHKSGLLAIGWRKIARKDFGYALLGYLTYFVMYLVAVDVASSLIHSLDVNQQQQLGFDQARGGMALVITFVSLVVLPPIVEETVFRGFVFSGLKNKLPIIWAALITSLLFSSAHLQFGSGKPLLWVAALDTFTLSMVLCYLRQKTGGLWAGMFVHALKNGVAFVSLFILHVH